MIEILYQDDALIAVNKPAGLAVHRSKMVGNAEEFLIDLLREQVGDSVYLAHRLDRATSGVLLIARSKEVAAALGEQFMGRAVHKQYLVVVRGWPEPTEGVVDYPLPGSRETGPRREARTHYVRGSNAVQWAMIRASLAAGADVYDRRARTTGGWPRSRCRSRWAGIRNSVTRCCWPNRRAAASARSASTWRTSITR